MRSSYRRDTGAGNTHRARITLTEVAMEKVQNSHLLYIVHQESIKTQGSPLESETASVTLFYISRWPGAAQVQL